MYLSVSHSPARFHWWHCSSSFMMWSVACLFLLSLGSLLVNSASGLAAATTGSLSGRCWAREGAAVAATASVAAAASRAFIGTSSPCQALANHARFPNRVHRAHLLHRSNQ